MTISGSANRVRSTVNPMAPYFVRLREFERGLILEAYEVAGNDLALTAEILGVHPHYVKARAKLLGGVFGGEPKHEPPGPAAKAWNSTAPSGRTRKKRKPEPASSNEPTPEGEPAPDA